MPVDVPFSVSMVDGPYYTVPCRLLRHKKCAICAPALKLKPAHRLPPQRPAYCAGLRRSAACQMPATFDIVRFDRRPL
jgi:hypothetical protein